MDPFEQGYPEFEIGKSGIDANHFHFHRQGFTFTKKLGRKWKLSFVNLKQQ